MAITKVSRGLLSTGVSDSSDATAITIDSSENVGIGTSSPAAKLQIQTQTDGNAAFQNSTSVTGGVKINCFNNAANASSPFELDGSTLQFNIASTERMRIDSSGNVGIGTTSPSMKVNISHGDQDGLRFNCVNTAETFIDFGDTDDNDVGRISYDHADNHMAFRTNAAERMRIDSSGDVTIGTTAVSVGASLTVRASSNDGGDYTLATLASDDTFQLGIRSDGAIYLGLDGSSPYNNTSGDSANAVIASNGFLFRSTSSQKYKKDITDATWGLSEVKQLRPVTFKNNNTGEFASDKTHGGLIAEEVHALGLTDFVDYNNDNEPDALHYGNMVALLTKAIQEQQEQIEALQSEINTLKGGD